MTKLWKADVTKKNEDLLIYFTYTFTRMSFNIQL